MAVVRTKKLSIICFREDSEKIIELLAQKRIFHPHVSYLEKESFIEDASEPYQAVSKLNYCLEQLEKYAPSGSGILSAIEDLRIEVSQEEISKVVKNLEIDRIFDEISSTAERIDRTNEKISSLKKFLSENRFFLNLNLKFRIFDIAEHRFCSVNLIRVSGQGLKKLIENLPELAAVFSVVSGEEARETAAVIVFHSDAEKEVISLLDDVNAQVLKIPDDANSEETLKEYYERKFMELDELKKELERLYVKIASFKNLEREVKIGLEYYTAELEKQQKKEIFRKTEKCVLIEGFVPENTALKLKREIEKSFTADCEISEPENSFAPVQLQNRGISKPVQLLTELYGYPLSNEPDPTPLIAPWFLMFFGFCIGDAGYGLLMALASLYLKKKFKLKESVKAFADIFAYGSIGAIILGVLSGSYFSLDTAVLPEFLKKLQLIDPINNPIILLVLSFLIGLVHLILGIAVNAYQKLASEKDLPAFISEVGKIILILGVAGFSAGMFGAGMPEGFNAVSRLLLVIGAFTIVFFSSKSTGVVRRILSGLYNLYGMTSYIGDTISYARLMALFLSSMLIGMAVNIMVKIIFEFFGFVGGIVLAPFIFVIGHLFNLLMSIISGFIHSMRLQFVEFFKQFYADGGVKFNPVGIKERYVKLVDRREL
jgi:V/A-type H+-transporting ATPase subunit I